MIMGCARKVAFSVWFLLIVLSLFVNLNFRTRASIITVQSSTKSVGFLKTMHKTHHNKKKMSGSGFFHHNLNLNSVSKRRVPNGPDPIHNRRVGTTRLPPT